MGGVLPAHQWSWTTSEEMNTRTMYNSSDQIQMIKLDLTSSELVCVVIHFLFCYKMSAISLLSGHVCIRDIQAV